MISDGIESFELPIWPEMYEEKGHLLKENQLLYAVLQMDRSQESTRLSCRWFDDLTKADEAMIHACDQSYDKAKHMVTRFAQVKKMEVKTEKAPEKAAPATQKPKNFIIKMNTDIVRLSQILQLKELLLSHRGETDVLLEFMTDSYTRALLHVDKKWSVTPSTNLEKKIQELFPG